jgi:hypothetical protein
MFDINKLMSVFKEQDITDIPDNLESKAKCRYIKKSINRIKNVKNISLIAVFSIPVFFLLFKASADTFRLNEGAINAITMYSIIILLFFIVAILRSSDLIRELELNLRDLENEIDLASIDLDSREKRDVESRNYFASHLSLDA